MSELRVGYEWIMFQGKIPWLKGVSPKGVSHLFYDDMLTNERIATIVTTRNI